MRPIWRCVGDVAGVLMIVSAMLLVADEVVEVDCGIPCTYSATLEAMVRRMSENQRLHIAIE